MIDKRLLTAAAVGVLTLSACKQADNGAAVNQTDEAVIDNMSTGNMAGDATATAGSADQTFVQAAAASDMFEIESSRVALDKSTLPAAKTYAQMMINEHGASSADLKALAGTAGIVVPAALPADKQAKVDALKGLTGAAFDRQYLADQKAGHQETLATLNGYVASAPAGPLKDHATKTIPIVQKHLNAVEKIK